MAESEPVIPTKRRLKPAAPTVREKAQKAQLASDKPAKKRRVRGAIGAAGRPVATVGKKVFNRQPFRFIGRIVVPRYLRNAFKELRLVEWPNRKTSWQLTYAVLVFAVVFGASIAVVDFGLDKLFKNILLK